MKKLLLLTTIVFYVAAQAQMKEGRIVYERTIQMQIRVPNMDPEIAKQLPKSRTDQFELLFGNGHSLWQYLPTVNADADNSFSTSSGNTVFRFNAGSNDISYCDFNKGTRTDQREVMDKNFIVSDTIQKLNWKLSDDTKTILNYTAHKATAQRIATRNRMAMENGQMKSEPFQDTATVIAWYTTDIPVATGPEFQGQLPGAILELDVNNGQTFYKAVEVSPKVNVNKIKEPKDGKKVTAAEFVKEREKIMEEMRKNMPEGMQIRVQN